MAGGRPSPFPHSPARNCEDAGPVGIALQRHGLYDVVCLVEILPQSRA